MFKPENIARLNAEHDRSVAKYGDWSDLDINAMIDAERYESEEFYNAFFRNDLHGPHGMIVEALHRANCWLKFVEEMERRK